MSRAFDWVDLPSGRARFAGGGGGGAEEIAHDTFAVEISGRSVFGEVREHYDGDVLALEIPTFGYLVQSTVGIPRARRAISDQQASEVETIVRELAETVAAYPARGDKPYVLRLLDGTTFRGDVRFLDGWFVREDAAAESIE